MEHKKITVEDLHAQKDVLNKLADEMYGPQYGDPDFKQPSQYKQDIYWTKEGQEMLQRENLAFAERYKQETAKYNALCQQFFSQKE